MRGSKEQGQQERQAPKEQHVQDAQGHRRSWFAPIVLVLLVLSMIGNVYYYTYKLQYEQGEKVRQGTAIIEATHNSQAHADEVLAVLDLVLAEETASGAEAAEHAGQIGYAFRYADSLVQWVAAAWRAEPFDGFETEAQVKEAAAAAIEQLSISLREAVAGRAPSLATQAGAEDSRLRELRELYASLQIEARAYEVSAVTSQTALQTEHGGEWIAAGRRAFELLAAHHAD